LPTVALWPKKAAGDGLAREQAQKTLGRWQTDAALAGIRDPEALALLPDEERDACRKLWTEVAAAIRQGRR
jgi:hypothetical protein